MGEPSPRYIAAHFLLPKLFEMRGASAFLAAIERSDAHWLDQVWGQAGFRFTPRYLVASHGPWRLGVITLPRPQAMTEAYLALVVGRLDDEGFGRLFLLEQSVDFVEGGGTKPATVVGEWRDGKHFNYGTGPTPSGDLTADTWSFAERALRVLDGERAS